VLAGLLLRLQERLVELLDFSDSRSGLGTCHAKRLWLAGVFFLFLLDARRFDSFAAAPKWRWILPSSFCAVLLRKIAFVFRVGLRRLLKRNRCANFSSPPRSE